MPVITARSTCAVDWVYRDHLRTTALTAGDVLPVSCDEYGSVYTLPWVYNVLNAAAFVGGDPTYRDYWQTLMSYSKNGSLAVHLYDNEDADGNVYVRLRGLNPDTGGTESLLTNGEGILRTDVRAVNSGNGILESNLTVDHMASSIAAGIYGGEADDYGPLVVIPSDHHEIHEGARYTASYLATGKNDGDKIHIYIKTPVASSGYIHMFPRWSSSGAAYFKIYEAPIVTIGTGTNNQWCINRNRITQENSAVRDNSNPNAPRFYAKDVTITNGGWNIYTEYSGVARQEGGVSRSDQEWVLFPDEDYIFELESDAAGLVLNLNLDWYEHISPA